jgi:hypothetical protein
MYFVSGFLMSRVKWFDMDKPEPVVTQLKISLADFQEQETLTQHLQDTFRINGRLTGQWININGLQHFEFSSLKQNSVVSFDSLGTTANLKVQPKNNFMAITAYHRAHKYGGGVAYNAYILLMDLSSLALLLFVLTGIYMWLGLVRYRWLGWGFLLAGFGYVMWVWITFLDF